MSEDLNKKQIINKVTDEQYITEWRSMLSMFKGIIKEISKPEIVKAELEELIKEAKLTNYLTPAQRNGIIERCNNYINGIYGKNLSHSS